MDLTGDFFAALRRMRAPALVRPAAPGHTPQGAKLHASPVSEPATRSIGQNGIVLIKQFEGCARKRSDGRFEAYPDPGSGGDPWTIGWGTTGSDVVPGLIWTQTECDARFVRDLQRYAREVARALGAAPTTQHQFDALVSFHYNTGAIARATLTRLHVSGRCGEAAEEFARWVRAGGKRLPGLVRRRAAEAALYRS